jgi:hypothetical protein
MLNLGYGLPLPASLRNYTSKKDKYLKKKGVMTFVSSMEKPSHKKCQKQSERGKKSLV